MNAGSSLSLEEDAAFKLQLSIYDVMEGCTDWEPVEEALNAAMIALHNHNVAEAIRLIDAACSIEVQSYPELLEASMDGARAARKDLERLKGSHYER